MGFKKKRIYVLKFDNPELAELDVSCTGPSISELLKVQSLETDLDEGQSDAFAEVISILAKHINTWNLEEDDGKPVPVNRANVESLDMGLLLAILTAWMNVVAGVTPNLVQDSNSGEISQVDTTLGLASLSQSLES